MGLKIFSWNINGLTATKFEDADLIEYLNKYDIIFMYESWLGKNDSFELNGYTTYNFYRKFQNRRANRRSGGVIVYIRNEIKEGIQVVKNQYDTII